jgi:hypothetical protein
MQYTEQQLAAWKQKHGELYEISVDDKSCILHKPTRQDLSYVSVIKDPIKLSETLLKQLWVEGDKEILEQDDLFIAVANKMDVLMTVKEAEVKKL